MGRLRPQRYPFRNIVVVVDRRPPLTVSDEKIELRRDLERTDDRMRNDVLEALYELGLNVQLYGHPSELASNAEQHSTDLVLSLFGGEISRNRVALVPAICEAYGLRCVGPDVYGAIIAQDKEVSKNLALQAGLLTPWHRIIRSREQAPLVRQYPLPYVVKPLLEGTSIGISQRNFIRTADDGEPLVEELLEAFHQPVIVEGFIPGWEASYNVIETSSGIEWSYADIHVDGDENFFDTHLFDAEEKVLRRLQRSVRSIDEHLSDSDRAALDKFVGLMKPLGYARIDGKHHEGRFHFLEVTPDAWIGKAGAFAAGFMNRGWSYPEIIEALMMSAFV